MKTALITGACINTGVAIVEKFASEGYNVLFTGRDPEKVKAAEEDYRKKFPDVTVIGYPIDSLKDERTVDEEAVEALFAQIDREGLVADTLVLNAADQGLGQKVFENPLTDFMKVLNTNVVWNFCLSEHAARRMKENGGGSIVFVNSNTAYRAIPDRVAYVASKGGQLGLMRALALDLGKYNIRVKARDLGGEDFAYFANEKPGYMYHLGVRNEEKGIVNSVHTDTFDLDESALANGVAIFVRFILDNMDGIPALEAN